MGFFKRVLGIEKRSDSTLKSPADWLYNALAGYRANSGVSVSESTALKSTAVFACVRIISEALACFPWFLYERTEGGKQRAGTHPLYDLLKTAPNPEISAYQFKQMIGTHGSTWGNFYAQIEFNNGGYPIGLWPLLPSQMTLSRDASGELSYRYNHTDGPHYFKQHQIFHIKPLSLNGIIGLSPIRYSREAIGLGLAEEEFGARFFGNGTNLGGTVSTDKTLSDTAYKHLKESIAEKYSGLSKSQLVMILEEGLKFEKFGIPPEDAQFLQSRKFQLEEIARIFRVPLHLLQNLDKATFSNIEHQSLEFIMYTMAPWISNVEQEADRKLLTPTERKRFYTKFLVESLLRGDIKTRYEAYAIARQWGWLSVNDIRELEDHNRIEGGDEYLSPLNMVPTSELEKYYLYLKQNQK